jgi:hypothetical protein
MAAPRSPRPGRAGVTTVPDRKPLDSVGLVCLCGKPVASLEGVARVCSCGRIWVITAMLIGHS